MMKKSSFAPLAGALTALLLAACSGADMGSLGNGGSSGGTSNGAANHGGTTSGNDAGGGSSMGGDDASSPPDPGPTDPSNGSPGPTSDAGGATDGGAASDGGASPDAAPPDAGAATNAFTGAGAYASSPPGTQAQQKHGFSLVGRNCFDCHGPNGGAPRFTFGGRVFTDATGATPAADVEVRVLDAKNTPYTAHSDKSGYVWVKGGTAATPAMAGARNATTTRLMNEHLADANGGGCNGCHNGTTTAYMHVP